MPFPALKLLSVLARQCSKPLAQSLQRRAEKHEGFRQLCIRFAGQYHYFEQFILKKFYERAPSLPSSKKTSSSSTSTACESTSRTRSNGNKEKAEPPPATSFGGKVEKSAKTMAEEETTKKHAKLDTVEAKSSSTGSPAGGTSSATKSGIYVPKLNDKRAVELGTTLLGEIVVFGVAACALLYEYRRSVLKELKKEADLDRKLIDIHNQLQAMQEEHNQLMLKHFPASTGREPRAMQTRPSLASGFWYNILTLGGLTESVRQSFGGLSDSAPSAEEAPGERAGPDQPPGRSGARLADAASESSASTASVPPIDVIKEIRKEAGDIYEDQLSGAGTALAPPWLLERLSLSNGVEVNMIKRFRELRERREMEENQVAETGRSEEGKQREKSEGKR